MSTFKALILFHPVFNCDVGMALAVCAVQNIPSPMHQGQNLIKWLQFGP